MTDANRPMRVLQVAARYLPDLGGIETHVHEVSRRLVARDDIVVTVAATDRTGARPRRESVEGFDVLRRRAWPRERDYYLAPGLVPLVRGGGWDLVHVQGIHTLVPVLAMAAARSVGIPYVVTFHTGGNSSGARNAVRDLQWRVLAPLLRGADALVAVSRFEQRMFAEATGLPVSAIRVIRNGGSLPQAATGVERVPGRIVSSGRLERYKGHHRVIDALPLVRESVPDARLDILGAGPYEGELRAQVAALGLDDVVTIRHLPPGDRAAMAQSLGEAAVFAVLSDYEAHPVAVMEALTLGVPVVGTDIAGVADLVEDGAVSGVPLGASREVVAAALVAAMSGGTSSSGPLELPTWDGAADALDALYREVLTQRAAGGARRPLTDGSAVGTHGPGSAARVASGVRALLGNARIALRERRGAAPREAVEALAGGQRALRVVHVVPGMAPGGAERQIEQLVLHGSTDASVICLYLVGTIGESVRAAGGRVDLLGMSGVAKLTAPLRLARRLRAERPDVVHVHLLSAQLFGTLAARLARVPVIVATEHSLMADSLEGRPASRRLRRVYCALERLVTRTVAVSPTTRDRMQDWGIAPERITVIRNGVDLGAMAHDAAAREQVRTEIGVRPGSRVVGAVGRLAPVKRFETLVTALAPLLAQDDDVHLVIAGEGELHDRLSELAAQLGVADRVHLLGARADVSRVLDAFDVMVSSSRDETFGIAVIEALANGLPVVYAECPAIDDDNLRPAWALQVDKSLDPVAEQAALAQAVRRLLGEPVRHAPPAALALRFGVEGFVAATEALYVELSRTQRH